MGPQKISLRIGMEREDCAARKNDRPHAMSGASKTASHAGVTASQIFDLHTSGSRVARIRITISASTEDRDEPGGAPEHVLAIGFMAHEYQLRPPK